MLNTVLFDLDGTLVQHGHVLLPALLTTWQEDRDLIEIKQAFAHQILWFYDHIVDAERRGGVEDLWKRFYQRILEDLRVPDADGNRARRVYHFFADHPVPPLFDDVLPVVDQLRRDGWKLGIITQRDRVGADRFLRAHGLLDAFPVVVAGDDGLGRKPNADPFHAAVTKLNVTPSQAIFVGDRIGDDCEGALNAGLGAFLIDRDNTYGLAVDHGQMDHSQAGYVSLAQLGQLLDHLPLLTAATNGASHL